MRNLTKIPCTQFAHVQRYFAAAMRGNVRFWGCQHKFDHQSASRRRDPRALFLEFLKRGAKAGSGSSPRLHATEGGSVRTTNSPGS